MVHSAVGDFFLFMLNHRGKPVLLAGVCRLKTTILLRYLSGNSTAMDLYIKTTKYTGLMLCKTVYKKGSPNTDLVMVIGLSSEVINSTLVQETAYSILLHRKLFTILYCTVIWKYTATTKKGIKINGLM